MRVLSWISVVALPLGLLPLAWITALAAGYCEFDCGTLGTLAINALIAACVVLLVAWLILLIAMIRRRVTRMVLVSTALADVMLIALLGFAAWSFGGV